MKLDRNDPWGGYITLSTMFLIIALVAIVSLSVVHLTTIESIDNVQIESVKPDKIDGYIISTSEGIFTNRDNVLLGKFETEEMNSIIQEADSCTLEYNLFELKFFDIHRNILNADCE